VIRNACFHREGFPRVANPAQKRLHPHGQSQANHRPRTEVGQGLRPAYRFGCHPHRQAGPGEQGYVFKRTDLPDEPTVAAHIDNVKQVERATTLGEGSVKIHTVEHLLSALRGCGIDNALLELNANEPPIGDGSGRLFIELLEKAGKQELDAVVAEYELHEPVRVTGRDGGYLIAWPSTGSR